MTDNVIFDVVTLYLNADDLECRYRSVFVYSFIDIRQIVQKHGISCSPELSVD